MTSSQSPGRVLDPPDGDFFPDDWKLYQRMADCGHELALDLKSLLEEKKFKEAYQLLATEHVLVAGHILERFSDEVSIDELNKIAKGVVHVSLCRMNDLKKKSERKHISDAVFLIVGRLADGASEHIKFSLAHAEKSRKGTAKLVSQTERKHKELCSRASAMRKLNPHLSNNSIATILLERRETKYRRSTILGILKSSKKPDWWI